jgi:hypothetical protein
MIPNDSSNQFRHMSLPDLAAWLDARLEAK